MPHRSIGRSYRVQLLVLTLLALGYCVGTLAFMHSWLLTLTGVTVPVVAGLLGRATSGSRPHTVEPLVVWGVATFSIFILSITTRFPVTAAAAALVALNSFVVMGAWALHRYPHRESLEEAPFFDGIVMSALIGTGTAVLVGAFASVIFVLGAVSRDPTFSLRNWALLMLAYIGAGVVGGIMVGLARPWAAYPLGRMVIGIPVAAVVYGFVGIGMLFMGVEGSPETLREATVMGAGIGVIAGPAGALTLYVSNLPAGHSVAEDPVRGASAF